ncbi:MAG: valine--tRNA ligase [Deltaproteobacteria bacterium]|nr:valine--tRNA ligase [Deltaproteobacteria bacterium]
MSTELPNHYDPHAAFARYAKAWEEGGAYTPDPSAPGEPYCIVIPPPNVTGSLHMGHALNNTVQDILIRYKRACGFNTLWVPGTDHAGIATQWIVEKQLRARGIDRRELGREKFLECVWEWKEHSGGTIVNQLKRLGVSCDWSRQRFTMDEGLSRAVRECFVRLYEEGLIYRATRLINWDPVGLTAISDLEVETEENVTGELWSFAYPLSDGSGEIVVATTRPETMLGDTAVAVHPEDPRYKALIGKTVKHPLLDREIPIVGDAILVDPAFGSGAVKVTPAHDFNDHAVGKRHGLPMITIFTLDARVNEHGGQYQGLDRFEARRQVKADIAALGLDRGSKAHLMTLPKSQRSGAVVEPMLSTQWFVKMRPLATPALGAVENGFTTFHPRQWENTYYAWMRNIQDWCISRQLWWGHRIPAWHCAACGEATVSRHDVAACGACGSDRVSQDDDVLDTWFSSALWPFSTLGWPDKTAELARWYPTNVLVTGFDIIFFWVARMMYSGIHQMGAVPFSDVYIHGLVRDEEGEKMSKTKGNVVDPLVAIEKHGADAFRMTLASLAGLGRDLLWSDKRVEQWTRFQNKVWQAFRFLRMHLSEKPAEATPGPMDRWILARAGAASRRIAEAIDSYRFNDAATEVHAFVWYELCDWYIEFSKPALYGDDEAAKAAARHTLWTVFSAVSRLLHPFMPFLAEELWRNLPGSTGSVIHAPFPRPADFPAADATLDEVALLQEAIVAVRRVRAEKELSPRVALQLVSRGLGAITGYTAVLDDLANVSVVEGDKPRACATVVVRGVEAWVPLEGILDLEKEKARLQGLLAKSQKSADFLRARLGNEGFVQRAKPELIEQTRTELAEEDAKIATLAAAIDALG